MSFELSFAPRFFFGPTDEDVPTSVYSAADKMRKDDPEAWDEMAQECFGCSGDFLDPETVLERVQEVNSCGDLSTPVDVWVDPEGWYTLDVYDGGEDE